NNSKYPRGQSMAKLSSMMLNTNVRIFFLQAEDGIRVKLVTGVQTCALPISPTTVPPDTSASPATVASASSSEGPCGPGTAGPGSRPSTKSQEPRTRACGVPTSSQYADS